MDEPPTPNGARPELDAALDEAADGATGRDAALGRLNRLWRWGAVTAAALALVVGLIGGSGQDGFAVFALVLAFTAVTVGFVGTLGLLRDDLTDRPVSRARIVVVVASFFGSALLMAMVAGVGG